MNTTKGETLDDSDWNTRSKSERQFVIRSNCHNKATLRRYHLQVKGKENRKPQVFKLGLMINTILRRETDPHPGYGIIDHT